jgi:hypothetical protein
MREARRLASRTVSADFDILFISSRTGPATRMADLATLVQAAAVA